MKEDLYTFIGFVVAAATPTLALLAMTPATLDGPTLETTIGLSPFILLFSALVTGTLGVPAFFLGRRMKLIRWWSASISGFVIGVGAGIILQWQISIVSANTILYGALGMISGFAFWLIWRLGQPTTRSSD
jgi:hypothetical protein